MYKKNNFLVDGFEDQIFEGIHDDSKNWNGWQLPLFNLETAIEIISCQDIEDCKKFEMSYYQISEYPKGIIEHHVDGVEFYPCVKFENIEYYPIGYGNWTWVKK